MDEDMECAGWEGKNNGHNKRICGELDIWEKYGPKDKGMKGIV